MNKKLLFAVMSLAALAACSTDDFESQKVAQEQLSPVKFEIINDAATRASWDNKGNTVNFSVADGDLFTLYHGAANETDVTGFENAAYKAVEGDGEATLSTPAMIKDGYAVMVWPVDTTFRVKPQTGTLKLVIPEELPETAQYYIPYVSDQINIGSYNENAPYNTAGKDRKYPVKMRAMASQLNLKADYNGTDALLKQLYEGAEGVAAGDGIEPITLTSVDLVTTSDKFTKEIPLKFTDPTTLGITTATQWTTAYNAWHFVTDFDITNIDATDGQTEKLTTKAITGTESAKFLVLPQATISSGLDKGGVIVNTYYGKVIVANSADISESKYTAAEIEDAWYRYVKNNTTSLVTIITDETKAATAEASGENEGTFKTTSEPKNGLMQTINYFSDYKATSGVTKNEPVGVAVTRYLKVLLNHLDMSDLHITSDKQLYDVVRVWKKLDLDAVTVILDGDKDNKEFQISQKTIKKINEINAGDLKFQVKPCTKTGEECSTIVITGADTEAEIQDIAFITANGTTKVNVALANETTAWQWKGTVKVQAAGVTRIYNRGTMVNSDDATLKTAENNGTQNNVPFTNEKGATWNITAGTLFVQFTVGNYGEVNISEGAEYRQAGSGHNFVNGATTLPERFLAAGATENIGVVNNSGVFATTDGGKITNVGLIEHAHQDAKTYITSNEAGTAKFENAFSATGTSNKLGQINLPYSNKNEDNVSISSELEQGFVSVTVKAGDAPANGILDASVVGNKVNYVIVNGGVTEISKVSDQVKYLEIADPSTEIVWSVEDPTGYEGLVVLSKVNIKLGTTIAAKATYLGANGTMYVGGTFNKDNAVTIGTDSYSATTWNAYYGNTTSNVVTNYVTY